jgi:hypothetical protein
MTRHNVTTTTPKEKVVKVRTKVIASQGMLKARDPKAKAKEAKVERVKEFHPMVTKEEKDLKANHL